MSSLFFKSSAIASWLPRLQSHRGYCVGGKIAENSLASIQKAFEVGYKIVEFDVRITTDKILVLHHDPKIFELVIKNSSFEELFKRKSLDRLEQVFEWLRAKSDPTLKLNVELKSRSVFSAALEKETCQLIKTYGLESQILISSFNPLSLMWVRIFNSKVYRALLLTYEKEDGNSWLIKSMLLNLLAAPHALHLRYQDWSENKFADIQKKVPVVLWTCNQMQILEKFKESIHGIISDEITPSMFEEQN